MAVRIYTIVAAGMAAMLSCFMLLADPVWAQSERSQLEPPNPLARPAEIITAPLAPGAQPAPDPFDEQTPLDLTFDPSGTGPTTLRPGSLLEPGEPTFEIVTPDLEEAGVPVQFSAFLTENGPALQNNLIWNVYALSDGAVGEDDLVATYQGGTMSTQLSPGSYLVHVSYGLATLARPLTVGERGLTDAFELNAGGMSLRGAITPERFLPDEAVSFQVFPETVENIETAPPLVRDVDERTVLVVPAGRYTIVSRYGNENAVVRAQIDVEPGQLTEAVMFHNAARILLKLVNEPNGEALPNTAWSVLNPGGDIVREFVGAFPSMVLSEGDYTIIARYDGQVFSRDFSVVAGVDREEELVAQ